MPGFGSVGIWEVILILAILLLVFGAKRLPEIGSALGKGIREFKGSIREIENEVKRPDQTGTRELPRNEAPRAEAPREAESRPPVESDRRPPVEADRRPPVEADRRTD